MKAAVCTRYGPPDVLQIMDVRRPVPRSNELLVRVRATAVTSSDCMVRRGFAGDVKYQILGRLALGLTGPRQPILGMALAGEVEATGRAVRRFRPGDRVYALTMTRCGAYAQYTCVPEASLVALMPSNATYEDAAAVPYGCLLALHFLRKGGIRSGQKVLVYGASGAVGTSAVQLAGHFGAEVTGVCSAGNLELVKSLGAVTTIDYATEDFSKRGELYDLIFVAVGNRVSPPSRSDCASALAPNGTYQAVDMGTPRLRVEDLLLLTELVEAGALRAVIDRSSSLEEIAEAHRYVEQGHKRGNVIITID
jgi:NADPH:quinone reductase-like Zn-dependent oxidoreductase